MIEMLITIAILAIVLTIGAPAFKEFINSSNMVSNSNDMLGAFKYARMEAIKRGDSVQLGQRDGDGWTGGIVVWVDTNADGSLDAGEELRLWEAFSNDSSVAASDDDGNELTSFVFNASGDVNNGGTLTLCDNRSEEQGRRIDILISGAVFAERVTCE